MGLPIWQRHKYTYTQPELHRQESQRETLDIRWHGGGHAKHTNLHACLERHWRMCAMLLLAELHACLGLSSWWSQSNITHQPFFKVSVDSIWTCQSRAWRQSLERHLYTYIFMATLILQSHTFSLWSSSHLHFCIQLLMSKEQEMKQKWTGGNRCGQHIQSV